MGVKLQAKLDELSENAIAVMKKHGLQVHAVDEAVAEEWERRARAGYPKIIGQLVSGAMVAEVERIRDEFRSQQP